MDKNEEIALDRPTSSGLLPRVARGKTWHWLLALLLCIVAGIGLWLWKSPGSERAGIPGFSLSGGGRRTAGTGLAQPVSVQAVRRQDIRVSVNAVGSIAASNTAVVHAQVSGVLQRLEFREGQQVKARQLLAQIDPRAFQASLDQAQGALTRDQAQLDGARVDLARYRDLFSKDALQKQQLDTQATLVGELEGTVELDQAAVAMARLQLSYTRVTAPISGRTGLKQADLGNVVQPGDVNGIVSITQTQPVALTFAVPSADLPPITKRLREGEVVQIQAFGQDGKTQLATGQVSTIDNAIDPATDTIKVKAIFPNADGALYPNQAVDVRLQLDTLADVLAVPQAAVLRGSPGFYVYVVNADHSVSTRTVTPGPVDGDWMAVAGALQPDEKIVIDGVDRLREGAKVEVIAADPRQRTGAGAAAADKSRISHEHKSAGGAASRKAADASSTDRSHSTLAALTGPDLEKDRPSPIKKSDRPTSPN